MNCTKLPGITSIAYILCSELTPDLCSSHWAGIPAGLFARRHPIVFSGHPECEAVSSVENNGRSEKVTLTFSTTQELPVGDNLSFYIRTASGESYLIGTKEDIPTVQITTRTGTPSGTTAAYEVEVSLTALKALLPIAA